MTNRVLILDDEESILFALGRYLAGAGFQVQCARELEEAEALAAHDQYDVAIIDVSLTHDGREGLEFLKYLRLRSPRTPVLVLTAHDSVDIRREAFQRGAKKVIVKPQALAEVARLVRQLIAEAAQP